jgi:hypothetical protein
MVRKLSTLLETLGGRPHEGAGRLLLAGNVFGVTSIFGGDIEEADVEVLSDEAFVFKSPPEMVGVGPMWVAGLDDGAQLKSVVRDAHARLKKRLSDDQQKLEALGMKPKLQPPEPIAAAELTLGGHVALITLDATGTLLVVEVSGRRVPQKSQLLGLALSDATTESVRGACAELVQKMQRAGLLTGRGMFDAATVRGPFAADEEKSIDAPSEESAQENMARADSATGTAQGGATVVAAVGDDLSGLKSDARRVPRPKRRSTEDARSGLGSAARSTAGAAHRSTSGDAVRSTTGAPIASTVDGESLLPSPAIDVGAARSSAPRATIPIATPLKDTDEPRAKDSNPFGPTSGETGVNVGVSIDDEGLRSEIDTRAHASGFDFGQDTGVGDALLSVPENSEEELARALEEFSSEEGGTDSLSDTGTEVHPSQLLASPTAESPGGLAVTAVPGLDPLDRDVDDRPSLETGEIAAFEDAAEHTAIAAPQPERDARRVASSHEAASSNASSDVSPDRPTDKIPPIARAAGDGGSLNAAWTAAETAAKHVGKAVATTSDIPVNFDIDLSTGEQPRTFSAEQTFNALQGVVGEGLSTGKTGAFILDAEAFAYLRGEAASIEVASLESEIAALEARLADARARLVALKAGQLQAAKEAEITAPKGRLAEKKKKLLEDRGRTTGEDFADLPSLASEIEPPSNTGPAESHDDDVVSDGVALADVARELERDGDAYGARADATQMVAAAYSHLAQGDDDDGVFDSRQDEASAVDINMNSGDDEGVAARAAETFEIDVDGATRVADIRSFSGAQTGPVGIVVADARALDRLTRHLEEQYENIVALSGLPPKEEIETLSTYRALVLVRPRADDETFARLKSLAANRRRPQVLCLSVDVKFDGATGIDLRIELAKKAGEVAQQVIDGLKQLGVSSGASGR